MFDGRISGERAAGETDERELGLLMAGIDPADPRGGMRTTLPRWADLALIPALNLLLALPRRRARRASSSARTRSEALRILLYGSLGSSYGIGFTLYYATTFVFTGLSVAIAFHAGLFNIGGEGQAALGGIGVTLVCLALPWPHWAIALPFAILGAGAVRRRLGVHPGLPAGQARQPRRHHHDHVQLHRLGAGGLPARQRAEGAGRWRRRPSNFPEGTFLPFMHEMLGAARHPDVAHADEPHLDPGARRGLPRPGC